MATRSCIERIGRRGCPEYAIPGKSRCRLHESEHERKRRTPSQRITETHRWRMLRARLIRTRPWVCGICGLPIETREEIEVDHIVSLAEGGEPYDEKNLELTHSSCNRRKRGLETQRRVPWRGNAARQFPWMIDAR